MTEAYFTYLSSIVSEEEQKKMELYCWWLGLEIRCRGNQIMLESGLSFLDSGIFRFRICKYPVDNKKSKDNFRDYVTNALNNGYHVLGWFKEEECLKREQDSYLIYDYSRERDSFQILLMFQDHVKDTEIHAENFTYYFMDKEKHCKDGKARLLLLKENSLWNEKVSKERTIRMLRNYLNGESVWDNGNAGSFYGWEAKYQAWKFGMDQKALHQQSYGIYRMLTRLKEKELAEKYRKIDWSREDAMEKELEILTKCYDILLTSK